MSKKICIAFCFILFLFFNFAFSKTQKIAVFNFKNKSNIQIKEFIDTGLDISGRILAENICNNLRKKTDFLIIEEKQETLEPTKKLSYDYVVYGEITNFSFVKRFRLFSQVLYSKAHILTYFYNTQNNKIEFYDDIEITSKETISIFNFKKRNAENLFKKNLKKAADIISKKLIMQGQEKPQKVSSVQTASPSIFDLYNQGISLYNSGEYEQAILLFEKILQNKDAENIFIEDSKRYIQNSKIKLDEIAKSKEIKKRSGLQEQENGYIDWDNGKIISKGKCIIPEEVQDTKKKQQIARSSAQAISQKNLLNIIYSIIIKDRTIKEICEMNNYIQQEILKIVKRAKIREEKLDNNNLEITIEILISDLQKIFPDIYFENTGG